MAKRMFPARSDRNLSSAEINAAEDAGERARSACKGSKAACIEAYWKGYDKSIAESQLKAKGKKADSDKPAAHIRWHGVMIDASFNKDGTVAFYTVGSEGGKFYTLPAAKEIAEARAKREKARTDANGYDLDTLIRKIKEEREKMGKKDMGEPVLKGVMDKLDAVEERLANCERNDAARRLRRDADYSEESARREIQRLRQQRAEARVAVKRAEEAAKKKAADREKYERFAAKMTREMMAECRRILADPSELSVVKKTAQEILSGTFNAH